jgi:protein-S-isoprenylcysteine O-methyltransferase Ste14
MEGFNLRNTLITILGTILVPCILHGLIPFLILSSTSELAFTRIGPMEMFSLLIAALGICMVVWVSTTFVSRGKGTAAPFLPPTEFVAIGLYKYVRNPMYIGLLLVILAEAIFFRSVWLLIYAFFLWLATHSYVVLIEEPDLKRRFGAAYREYLMVTPRWVPRPPRKGA